VLMLGCRLGDFFVVAVDASSSAMSLRRSFCLAIRAESRSACGLVQEARWVAVLIVDPVVVGLGISDWYSIGVIVREA